MKFDLSLDNVIDFSFYFFFLNAETDLAKLGEGSSHMCFIDTGLCLKIKIAKSSETCKSPVNSFTRSIGQRKQARASPARSTWSEEKQKHSD